jgi:hypothetical protein
VVKPVVVCKTSWLAFLGVQLLERVHIMSERVNGLSQSGDVDRYYGMDVGQGACHFANFLKHNMVRGDKV